MEKKVSFTIEVTEEDKEKLTKISRMVKDINFGQVTINIQNGKIVQVEKTEKFRINEL